jgi:hypothetical protein
MALKTHLFFRNNVVEHENKATINNKLVNPISLPMANDGCFCQE